MGDRAFNLLREKWIWLMRKDGSREEVSLTYALIHAHEFQKISGELPTQDIALLRLLLAVLHAVFYRVNPEGEEKPLTDDTEALDRWEALWNMGFFPEAPIREYLDRYEDRFWLFDSDRPFYQVSEAQIGTSYTSAKLNGEISESANKVRMFSARTGQTKERLTFAEAARWLLYVNGFDDTSAKPKGKNLPSIGAGWLGKLGLIAARGNNLFETLMLNFVCIHDWNEIWDSVTPVWERSFVHTAERSMISIRNDQAELLTLQSRRLFLKREEDAVTGFWLLGGDFFDKVNALAEQMTVWQPVYEKKNIVGFQPKRHDPSKRLWREFGSLISTGEDSRQPGIIQWHSVLEDVLPEDYVISYDTPSVLYGDKDFFVKNVFADGVSFHANLLSEMGLGWRMAILHEIDACETLADIVRKYAANLDKASGGDGLVSGSDAREQFFYRIDIPFRSWLEKLDARQNEEVQTDRIKEWRSEAAAIARQYGRELMANAGEPAIKGRVIKWKDKKSGKEIEALYTASEANLRFLKDLKQYERRSE